MGFYNTSILTSLSMIFTKHVIAVRTHLMEKLLIIPG